jgi:Outer membrane protein beta-barrel domain
MMKKASKLQVIVLMICAGYLAPAQCNGQTESRVSSASDPPPIKFHLSLEGGVNISSLPGVAQGKPIYGINVGLGTLIRLSDKWALTPELKPLSQRGATDVIAILALNSNLQNPKTDFLASYVDIPILVRYKISNRLFAGAGPQISFLTSADQSTTATTSSGQSITDVQDMKSLMHKESFMVPVEIGYSKLHGTRVDIKVRYNFGVMEAFTATSLASSTHSTLQFILSVPFINVPQKN